MMHSSLEPLNEKLRQLCQVEGKKQVQKASGRQFPFLKEQQKLAPKLLQNVASVAWESGRPARLGMTYTARCLHSPCPFVHTHIHMHIHTQKYSFLQPQCCLLMGS